MIRRPPRSTLFPLHDALPISVDDETFLILNDDRTYASQLLSSTSVTSFSIFFRPRMAEEVARTHALPTESLIERSEEHTSELQSQSNLVCRLLLEKKK